MTLLDYVPKFIVDNVKVFLNTAQDIRLRVSRRVENVRQYTVNTATEAKNAAYTKATQITNTTIASIRAHTPKLFLDLTDHTVETGTKTLVSVYQTAAATAKAGYDTAVAVEHEALGITNAILKAAGSSISSSIHAAEDIAYKTTESIFSKASFIAQPYVQTATRVGTPYYEKGRELAEPYVERAKPYIDKAIPIVLRAQDIATPYLRRLPVIHRLAKQEIPTDANQTNQNVNSNKAMKLD